MWVKDWGALVELEWKVGEKVGCSEQEGRSERLRRLTA